MTREYDPYFGYAGEQRDKDEARWSALEFVSESISRLREQGKDITYENLAGFSPRLRAMIRHFYLQDGRIYDAY
jgi:hypothetical protein